MSSHNANLIPNSIIKWHLNEIEKFSDSKKLKTILDHFNLTPELLEHQGVTLNATQYAELIKLTITTFDDESFSATKSGIRSGAFELMTHACITCTNLKKSIERMLSFYRVISVELTWDIQITEHTAEITFDLNTKQNKTNGYFSIFMMSSIWRWLSWMIAKPIFLNQVELTITEPTFSNEISKAFNSDISFNKPNNKLIFNRAYLPLPVRQTPQSLITFLINTPECLLSHYKTHLSVSNQVREFLEAQQKVQAINLEQLADSFSCSPQTITRSLRRENNQFKEIKDKIIKQRAINLLLKSELSIEQIAFSLGFAEPSTFYRNFKKWTLLTPTQFRHKNS